MKELEERGIGRPSTYVSVIETILARDYVFKKGTALVPTWKAFAKVQLLERHFAHLIDYDFTATMEEALDAVARGEGEAEKWLDSFYFGNGQAGLRELVVRRAPRADRHGRGQRGARRAPTRRATSSSCACGPTAPASSAATRRRRSPLDLAPDELTPEKAEELLAKGGGGPRDLGTDPDTGLTVLALTGRFGPFVQLGEQPSRARRTSRRARRCSRRWSPTRSRSRRRCSCSRCRASSASTPTARRSPRRTAATGPTSRRAPTAAASARRTSSSR